MRATCPDHFGARGETSSVGAATNLSPSMTILQEIQRIYLAKIEEALITRIEILLGRVPTNEEIAKRCQLDIHPDGRREYKWDGQTILRADGLFGGKWEQDDRFFP